MSNQDIIDTLNRLIETSKDGEYGFRSCAEHATGATLQQTFNQRADECHDAVRELQLTVKALGGQPEDSGTTAGAMHRGWVAVRATLAGYSDLALLEECERGEDVALGRYRKALAHSEMPVDVRALLQRQSAGVQRNHDQMRDLRNEARVAAP